MYKDKKVIVVMPAYNAAKTILKTYQEVMSQDIVDHVIVVDDASHDHTAKIAKELPNTSVYVHDQNKGYGASLKTGIRAAKYPWIAITDADGTYPNQRIAEMLSIAQTEDFDMIVGSRTGAKVHIPLIRRPAKWSPRRRAPRRSASPPSRATRARRRRRSPRSGPARRSRRP